MKKVWIVADSIVSPLGSTTDENYANVRKGVSGLQLIQNSALNPTPFFGGIIEDIKSDPMASKFEAITEKVIHQLIEKFHRARAKAKNAIQQRAAADE